MVMIGLLLIALISLALGLVLPSSAWLIASLIASGGAGYLLWKARSAIAAATATPAHVGEPVPAGISNGVGNAPASETSARPSLSASTAAADVAASSSADEGEVWVIDGRPRYHLAECAIIQGQDAEPIPFEQATEDGFMACSLCEPNVVLAR
jgi:hypothetical protein